MVEGSAEGSVGSSVPASVASDGSAFGAVVPGLQKPWMAPPGAVSVMSPLLARVRREIEALTFLQRVVAREDAVVGRLGNADLLRLLRRTVHAPAEAREIGKARVVRRSVGRVRRSASAAGDERNNQDHNGQDQDACGDQPRL